jgi:transposase
MNSKNIPSWATNDEELMIRCAGKRAALRLQIARYYWQNNMTTQDVATACNVSVGMVEAVIHRLKREL